MSKVTPTLVDQLAQAAAENSKVAKPPIVLVQGGETVSKPSSSFKTLVHIGIVILVVVILAVIIILLLNKQTDYTSNPNLLQQYGDEEDDAGYNWEEELGEEKHKFVNLVQRLYLCLQPRPDRRQRQLRLRQRHRRHHRIRPDLR